MHSHSSLLLLLGMGVLGVIAGNGSNVSTGILATGVQINASQEVGGQFAGQAQGNGQSTLNSGLSVVNNNANGNACMQIDHFSD